MSEGPHRTRDSTAPLRSDPASFRALLRCHPQYRRLFASRTISLLGDWFNLLALLALLRELGHHDATATGGAVILKFLPVALVGPLAGVLADRWPRRRLMIGCDLARCVLVLAMFAAPLWPRAAAGYLLALTFLQTVFAAIGEPARSAAIPDTVPGSALATANRLSVIGWSATYTFGAAVGGLVTAAVGWRIALAIDALSYLASIACVARLRLPPPARHERDLDATALFGGRDMRDALRFLARRRSVLRLLWIKVGWGLGGAMTVLLTLLGGGPLVGSLGGKLTIPLLFVGRGVGMGLGPLVQRWWGADQERRRAHAIAAGFLLYAGAYTAVPLALWLSPARALWCVLALVLAGSIGESTLFVQSTLLLQRALPDRLRGRVLALDIGASTVICAAVTTAYSMALDAGWIALRTLPGWLGGGLFGAGLIWIGLARRSLRSAGPLWESPRSLLR